MARQKRYRRSLKSKWRNVFWGVLLLSLATIYQVRKLGRDLSEDQIVLLFSLVLVVVGICLAYGAIWLYQTFHQEKALSNAPKSFRTKPWEYAFCYIALYGKVEVVLRIPWQRRARIWFVNWWRNRTGNNDPAFRYEHLRLLISSPQLQKGEWLLVSHNTQFGRVSIHEGDWVKICGEYLHQRRQKRGPLGPSLTYYGLVHKTHEPLGYIRALEREPELKEQDSVVVIEREKLEKLKSR